MTESSFPDSRGVVDQRTPTESSVADRPSKRSFPRRFITPGIISLLIRCAKLAGFTVVIGVVAGLVWHRFVTLPSYTASEDGLVAITNRAQSQYFGTDAMFIIIGLIAGLVLGYVAWRLFFRLGWPVCLFAMASGFVSALVCWAVGAAMGPHNFEHRVAAALPGDRIPIDFSLHAPLSVTVWIFASIVPIMLYANFSATSF